MILLKCNCCLTEAQLYVMNVYMNINRALTADIQILLHLAV